MQPKQPTPRPHFYLLIDRSGSMASMRSDVIGGFNALLAEHQAAGDDARFTVVQFDSQDPQEIVVDAVKPSRVQPLSDATFQPRGGTPLLDATGQLIARAAVRQEHRKALGKRPEVVTVVTITDGEENQSREYSKRDIVRLVEKKTADGWTFAFLGLGLDAYAEAGGMGYDARSVQPAMADAAGTRATFDSASKALLARRHKIARAQAYDAGDLFEGAKGAEADLHRRRK